MITRQEQQKENWSHSGSAFTVSTVFFLIRCRFCCAAVGSVSSQAGITSCELSKLEQAFLLPPGSPVVLPERGGAGPGGGHMLVCIFSCWLSPDHNNAGLSLFLLPSATSPAAEGRPVSVLAAPVSQSHAGRGWR